MARQKLSGFKLTGVAGAILVVILLIVGSSAAFRLDEAEQAIIVQFGAPVGEPITEPGLHFKLPFVQEVRRFEKGSLAWDGDPNQIPTRGRECISIDTTARWRISDPLAFLKSLRDESGAQSRLDDIIDSVVRDTISATSLEEIVRSQSWSVAEEEVESLRIGEDVSLTSPIEVGREGLTRQIVEEASAPLERYGIDLIDVRIKRLNYIASVQQQVFNRMISERQRIAAQYRSEGEGVSAEILGQSEKQLAEITSEANRAAEVIRGEAEAEATAIFNEAFGIDPEFYAFYRTLDSYRKTIAANMTLFLSRDSAFFRYLEEIEPEADQ